MRLYLTKRAEYGVRLLTTLAEQPAGQRVTTQQLAVTCNIPPGNVPGIITALARSGYIASTPGRFGGCTLTRAAQDVTVLAVIEALEGPLVVEHCLLDSDLCPDRDGGTCPLHDGWVACRSGVLETLAGTTLADLTGAREASS